jgi:hypothetical protein
LTEWSKVSVCNPDVHEFESHTLLQFNAVVDKMVKSLDFQSRVDKSAMRVRTPSTVPIFLRVWSSGLRSLPVTQDIAGSNPVTLANFAGLAESGLATVL